jgi:hypothetical protein
MTSHVSELLTDVHTRLYTHYHQKEGSERCDYSSCSFRQSPASWGEVKCSFISCLVVYLTTIFSNYSIYRRWQCHKWIMMDWKGLGRKRSWPNFKVLYRYSLGGTEENHEKTSIRVTGRRGRDLNPRPPEYEGVLTTRPRRSVNFVSQQLHVTSWAKFELALALKTWLLLNSRWQGSALSYLSPALKHVQLVTIPQNHNPNFRRNIRQVFALVRYWPHISVTRICLRWRGLCAHRLLQSTVTAQCLILVCQYTSAKCVKWQTDTCKRTFLVAHQNCIPFHLNYLRPVWNCSLSRSVVVMCTECHTCKFWQSWYVTLWSPFLATLWKWCTFLVSFS